jgi:UPF0755 protein
VALEQADGRVKAGEYVLHPAMSPRGILDILTRGGVLTHRVTIPEGFTARQIARLLAREGLCTETAFLKATRKPELGRPYGLSAGLEGFLFPDTYHFSRGLSATTLARIMVRRFFTVIEPLQPRISQSELDLPEIVTLASIVEKETGTPNERPLIASVFINRLRRNMRLQSDPTVIYGIRDFNGNLTRKDLKTPGPYNTYRNSGLPPGPIANPGLAAIEAVLSPAQTRYLYFVSKNNGTHHFSRTLREHNQAVRRYQLGRN